MNPVTDIFKSKMAMVALFNVAKVYMQRYLNTVTSQWVSLIGALKALKQSLLYYVAVTIGTQGDTACQWD